MPLRLDIKRKLTARSDRVKSVDLHPTEPWMLASLYNGNVHIWNHESQQLVKSFEVCDLPVRAAVFVPRKNWIVTGSDDMQVRVFNYNTLEKAHSFEAHSDYVRCIVVHPTQPYILTSSDDMLIKLWNWEKQWVCQQVFEGHTHYVMQIVINTKDNNTLASASLDRTVKVWQLGSSTPNFTLEGHEKGVNCVDYYHGGDKPYLISGADDRLVKIWDYQNKTCVQTLEGHAQNISAVCFHPELPIVLTGSEDGTVRIWHSGTYRLESSLNYGFERVWTIACLRGSNNVALGYDEGSIMVKVGREEPAVSMDISGEKIIWARHSEIQQVNLKAMPEGIEIKDGERLPVAVKDMGSCEIYPQTIAHNPNGRFVVVCGDGEYIIYTAMVLRNKAFGSAHEFVWGQDSSEYAIREGTTTVKVFKNFKEKKSFKPDHGVEGIFGGYLLGVRSMTGLSFYDWENLDLIRRIEIQPKHVYWTNCGDLVALATDDSYFILRYDTMAFATAKENNSEDITEDGLEETFDVLGEVHETVRTGLWIGDCFVYTNSVNRINYYVGGEIVTVSHLDRTMYVLGYVPKDNRLYLGDKELNIVSYSLLLSVLGYQTFVMRGEMEKADSALLSVPTQYRTRVAHFLEKQGFKQKALEVSTDPEHRFDLALQLGDLSVATELAREAGHTQKWRQLSELAMNKGDMQLTQECLLEAQDFAGLLMLASSSGDEEMMKKLAVNAKAAGKVNVSFMAYLLLGNIKECIRLLMDTGRFPEATFLTRTYMPAHMSIITSHWALYLDNLKKSNQIRLADPLLYPNLFPDLVDMLKTEKFLYAERVEEFHNAQSPQYPPNDQRNPIQEMKDSEASGKFKYEPFDDPNIMWLEATSEGTEGKDTVYTVVGPPEELNVKNAQANKPKADETSKPTVETSKPTVERSKPTVETSKPTVETSKPTVETSKPTVETSKPTVETSKPTVEPSKPTVTATNLVVPKDTTKEEPSSISSQVEDEDDDDDLELDLDNLNLDEVDIDLDLDNINTDDIDSDS